MHKRPGVRTSAKTPRLWHARGTGSSFFRRQSGQALAEYALILAFVACVITIALLVLGPVIVQNFCTMMNLNGGFRCATS